MVFPCYNKLLTTYPGTNLECKKVIFNYYLSQIRVKIEQAFGFMTNKWLILDSPIKTTVAHAYHLIMCIAQLHNYVINEGEVVTPESSEVQGTTCFRADPNIRDECDSQKERCSKRNHLCDEIYRNHLDIPYNNHIISP